MKVWLTMFLRIIAAMIVAMFVLTWWANETHAGMIEDKLGASKVPAIIIEYTMCEEELWVVLGHVNSNLAASSGLGRGWQAIVAQTLVEAMSWAAMMADGGDILITERELVCEHS